MSGRLGAKGRSLNNDWAVQWWWGALAAVGVSNIAGWAYCARPSRAKAQASRLQLALSLAYVLGCAFRALLPRVDARRFVMWDHWLSSAAVGRSVATIAELAFTLQWVLLLDRAASTANERRAAWMLVPIIGVAELCSWYATLTTNHLGGVIEESLWAVAAAFTCVSLARIGMRERGSQRRWLFASATLAAGFCAFLVLIDVPMYWARWQDAVAAQQPPVPLALGWQDALHRRLLTRRWEDWAPEIPWMSMYFSLGVWTSIALTRTRLTTSSSERP
jgi:hypothetical protein